MRKGYLSSFSKAHGESRDAARINAHRSADEGLKGLREKHCVREAINVSRPSNFSFHGVSRGAHGRARSVEGDIQSFRVRLGF